jgi:hypothetical protein
VAAGNPGDSALVKVQRAEHPAKLPDADLALIIDWIEQEAPDN